MSDLHHTLRRLGRAIGGAQDAKLASTAATLNKEAEHTAAAEVTSRLSSATPASVGSSGASGSSTSVSRADHVHAHGAQAGGATHSEATTSVAGFLSAAGKTLLDLLGSNKAANTVFAGPASGSDAVPAFRALVAADMPVMPSFRATKNNTDQTGIENSTWTLVTWTETSDPSSFFASNVWTPSAGTYLYVCSLRFDTALPSGECILALWNTTQDTEIYRTSLASATTTYSYPPPLVTFADANGTDSFGIKVYCYTAAGTWTINGYTATWAGRRIV